MSERHDALMANLIGNDPGEPKEDPWAITNVRHPSFSYKVTLRIYAPSGWNGDVEFTESYVKLDGELVSDDDIRRGWTAVGGE
jgi:hypothetical protein